MDSAKPKHVIQTPILKQTIISPIRAGTGAGMLAPPWSRSQVSWFEGKSYYILRIASDEVSRFLVGAGMSWDLVFPHERTFKRSAIDKSSVMASLKMNPWPAHLVCDVDVELWRSVLAKLVESARPVYDTGYVTLWQVSDLPQNLVQSMKKFVVLDGHHSRRAQHHLGLKHVFGWVEPVSTPHLQVRSIDRAGWLSEWLNVCLASKQIRVLSEPPPAMNWTIGESKAFEVIQVDKRWWAEVVGVDSGVTALDRMTDLAKNRVQFKTSANLEELMGWLERLFVDTVIRFPIPTKQYVFQRALEKKFFPQKATYFFPKIPFGLLVENLA